MRALGRLLAIPAVHSRRFRAFVSAHRCCRTHCFTLALVLWSHSSRLRPQTPFALFGNWARKLSREGTAATATPRSLRILEHKSLAHQVFLIIERGVVEVEKTLRVHKYACAILFENFVPAARFGLQPHGVRKAGASPALHAHTKTARC